MKLTSKEIGSYLIWVAVNLVILLVFGSIEIGDGYFDGLYPFSNGFECIWEYDISEFLVYTIIPLLIILAIKNLKGNNSTKNK